MIGVLDGLGQMWDYLSDPANWQGRSGITHRLAQHMWISVIAIIVASLLALPPALWLGHRRKGSFSRAVVGIGAAIPPYALLGILLPISIRLGLGLGFWPTLATMVVLGVPPIFLNTLAAMAGLDSALLDAADGLGMRPIERFRSIELPLAAPFAIGGIGLAAVQVIATATIGVYAGYVGLGSLLAEGFAQFDTGRTLSGAALVSIPAILAMWITRRVQHRLTAYRSAGRPEQAAEVAEATG